MQDRCSARSAGPKSAGAGHPCRQVIRGRLRPVHTHVDLVSSTIKGGTITTAGGGVLNSFGSSTLDGSAATVTITAGSTIQVGNNTALNLAGTIAAAGKILLNSVGNVTDVIIAGASTTSLTGPGGITTSDSTQNRIYGAGAGAVLDNVNSVISGAGQIGINTNLTLKNEALIDANLTSALLINSPNAVANTGILRASNTAAGNGGLVLSGTTIDNRALGNSGLITAAGANSHVDIVGGTTILGGTLTGTGGGTFNVSNSTLDGSGAGAQIHIAAATTVNLANNNALVLNGTIDNKGTVALNSSGNITDLIVGSAGVRLGGGGVILLSDNAANRIYTNTPGTLLENVDNTITGAGQIFQNSGLTLKNDTAGVINATGTQSLTIGSFSASPVQNLGLLEATNTGGLVIAGGTTIDNTANLNAGRITAAGTGAHVDINSSTILGGTLTGTGGGTFNVSNSTLDGTTAGAPLHIATGTTVNVANNNGFFVNGAIDNKGTIALNSAGNVTDLIVGGAGAKLTGGGAITFSDNAANRIYTNTPGTLLENVDNTISGAGQIFQNSGLTLKNDAAGVINASGTQSLTIGSFSASPVQNLGLLEATNTGGLVITGGTTIDNTANSNAGRIVADGAGAHVDIIGNSTVLGGTLTGKNGGTFNVSNSTLDGTTAGAPLHIATGTTVSLANNNTLFLAGTIDNKGTIALNSAGNVTDLIVDAGGAKLTGGGAILLSDSGANRIYTNTGGTVLTNVDNTISGAGQIFQNSGLSLTNTGTVDATGSNALVMSLDIANNAGGTLRASGAGGLIINSNTTTNNGTVEALNGSAVTFNGSATVANNSAGTLSGGIWRAISTGTGAAVTLTGPAIVTNAADIYLSGTGSTLIAGGASIDNTLTTNNGSLRIQDGRQFISSGAGLFSNNELIELASGTATSLFHTAGTLVNQATGAITGYGTVNNLLQNAGLVQASLGKLSITGGIISTNGGTVQALTGATIDLSTSLPASTAGNLLLSTGGALNLGSANITVFKDYNNANFGTGNAFNNHAGVSGTGLILASGTGLAMTVSGTGITGGGTATPGLALGSVHVGSPLGGAFDIAWNGSGAPSLRGAVQNTSGLSVSAPGFGPILPGGSAHETVSVAAGAAGSLAGQSLKIVSNFDNVAAKTIAVTGAAYDFASPAVAPLSLAFGNVHVGDAVAQQAVGVANTVITSAAFQEGLDASVGTLSSGVTTTGSITNLAAGGSSTSLKVGIGTATAGAVSGSATIGLVSNGAGTSGLGLTTLAGRSVGVTGAVFDLASATVAPATLAFGNFHVGDAVTQQTVGVANGIITSAAFQEGLNATISAASGITTTGSITNLAAGGSSTALKVGISTATAGAIAGTATVGLVSNGAGTSGLGLTTLAGKGVGITGGVFNLASSSVIAPINLGVRHVGDGGGSISTGITITNTAAAGAFSEGLNSSFGGYSNAGGTLNPTFTGSIANLIAGGTDSASLVATLSTATAGIVSGSVTVHQASNGTISGLANTALADQNPGVSGTVSAIITNLAQPVINTAQPVSFGNVRLGSSPATQALSITNAAPTGGFSESLIAVSAGTTGTGITVAGGFGGASLTPSLAPQATDAAHVTVGIDTASAGAKSGNAILDFKSDGTAFAGGSVTDLGQTNVAVIGAVYRLAKPTLTTASVSLAARVGDASPGAGIGIANASPDIYTEGLKAALSAAPAGFTATGAIANLAAGGSDTSSLKIALNTAASGTFAGNQTVQLASTGAGTTGAADLALASQTVALTGKVYQAAIASVTPSPVDFGIVHVGDAGVTRALTIGNSAAGALNDVLQGGFGAVSGPFSGAGTLGAGVAAGSSAALQVALSTATAGVFNGTAALNLASHDSDLADLAVTAGSVGLNGTVNNYALSGFGHNVGGAMLSGGGHAYTLDFGKLVQGSIAADTLSALNLAIGPADLLAGNFTGLSGTDRFSLTGFGAFTGIVAAGEFAGLSVSFVTDQLGTFSEVIDLHGFGSNASGYNAGIADSLLTIEGTIIAGGVVPTPEPGTLALLASGLAGLLGFRRRQ